MLAEQCSQTRWVLFGSFPSHPTSVRDARALVRLVDSALPDETVSALRLVIGEFVTNSVEHGPSGDFSVKLVIDDGLVRVEVADSGNGDVWRCAASDEDEHGRGLALVDAIADRWGSGPGPTTFVWAELAVGR